MILLDTFIEILPIFHDLPSFKILAFLWTDMAFGRALTLFLAIQVFDYRKHRAVHSTGRVIECEESHCSYPIILHIGAAHIKAQALVSE